ncbi:MAG: bifunctional UDP-N-acetylmuramoyl-tripeptide:D-alanyl-D-alanine ligase/alanine racemase [Cyclobacteriaceae bacterium]|nr:bifunctional UDP-N-acetylmuramoyl-tripeptide:D-alanyl-D-alanine ligase/alanine racemase [Cyclobacteriaceae bacterium]
MLFSQLEKITDGKTLQLAANRNVSTLVTDSRKPIVSDGSVFFALRGERHDGHQYIAELYQLGIRQFVIENWADFKFFPEGNFIQVASVLAALQAIASEHRKSFSIPIIGISGSNGKTIIKEWLFQLLSLDQNIAKNPGSYNSQIGVPLSVWGLQTNHQLGIFEAGISLPGEMEKLEKVIHPTIGIFTNIGTAHDEGFVTRTEKIEEKLKLFSRVGLLIYCADHTELHEAIQQKKIPSLTWGSSEKATIKIKQTITGYELSYQAQLISMQIPFADKASIENCFHCVAVMLHLGYSPAIIQERVLQLKSVPMRLELKQGINRCQVIDDTYNNDLAGLKISLDFLNSLQKKEKTLILSDILQSGLDEIELVDRIKALLNQSGISSFVGIGSMLSSHQAHFRDMKATFFRATEEFLLSVKWENFESELILIKGARPFQFEKIVQQLQRKVHGTVMEIDLNKMVHNLNFFKSKLKPGVKLMAMVKAFAYGSGSEEVANLLQYHKVDYLGVAYADEGVELRKNNISLPIMVMNPAEENFPSLLSHCLEPVMYSLKMLRALSQFIEGRPMTIHVEVDTGMHRLGFDQDDLPEIITILKNHPSISVASVYSHLAGADEAAHDGFSQEQFDRFQHFYKTLTDSLGIKPLRHILNSPGILRFPDFQMEMVRLGIGLYGVNPTEGKVDQLQPVATLKTIVSQIKKVKKGETIGYGRKGKAENDMSLATIAIGYADGFSRSFSKGKGFVSIKSKKAPVVGNVCMDMTMVDVTHMDAQEGDEVIVFGAENPIQEVAASINTIPYEILTNTSERVKRVFFAESI